MDPTDLILELRQQPGVRSALRRADRRTTEHYAYPYLASLWDGRAWLRQPLLRFAALAATYPRIRQADGHTLGRTLAASPRSATTIERRLLGVQLADLERFHVTVRSLLGPDTAQVDWHNLWTLYRNWELPDPDRRRRTRRRLLEDYYHNRDRTDRVDNSHDHSQETTR